MAFVFSVPKEVGFLAHRLHQNGFEVFTVGGAVRDLFLKRPTQDWDLTTNASPEQIQTLFPESFYENEFGTVGVAKSHLFTLANLPWPEDAQDEVFEITTYRTELEYQDHRRPTKVEWGKTLKEDLSRRDFTINALALQFDSWQDLPQNPESYVATPEILTTSFTLIDEYQGKSDLDKKIIRTVGVAEDRFNEDALRMLRAVRFAAQLNFALDQETLIALQNCAEHIQHISWERIRDEFLKIIVTDYVEQALNILATTGILQYILPELLATKNIDQRGHHEYDVWKHSLLACQTCPSKDPIVRFATLLHDIAKPETQAELPELPGEYSFFNHEVIGARTAREVARRFRLSKDDTQRVFTLVRWHMFHYQRSMTDAAIRRFIRRVGKENIDDILSLREGDRMGSGSQRTSWRLEEMKDRIHEQLHQPMQINEMVVDGTDVMSLLNIPPSRQVGDILKELFVEVFEDPTKNDREYLLERIRAFASK